MTNSPSETADREARGEQGVGPLAPEGFLAPIWQRSKALPREGIFGSLRSVCRRSAVIAVTLPVTHVLLILAFAVTTFFCLMFFYGVYFAVDFLERAGGKLTLTVFVDSKIDPTKIEAAVRGIQGVQDVRFIPPEEAFRELESAVGDRKDIFAGIDASKAIPPSFDVIVADTVTADDNARESLLSMVGSVPGVTDVISSHSLVGKLHEVLRQVSLLGWACAVLAVLLVVFVGFSTQRLALLLRRQEFNIMSLVGASPSFIAAPVVLVGFVFGTLGGLVGAVLFLLATRWLLMIFSDGGSPLFMSHGTPPEVGFVILAVSVGAIVGTLSSAIAVVRRHSDVR